MAFLASDSIWNREHTWFMLYINSENNMIFTEELVKNRKAFNMT